MSQLFVYLYNKFNKMKKIKKDELSKLVELNTNFRELKFQLADIEVTFNRLNSQKVSTLANIETAAYDLSLYQDKIVEQYGDIKVNLQTGEYN
jgi:hypothetical protein